MTTTTRKISRAKAEAALAAVKAAWAPSLEPRDHSGHAFETLEGDALIEHLKAEHFLTDSMIERRMLDFRQTLAEAHAKDHKPESIYPTGPVLVEDWNGEGWAICWEEGPDDWAMHINGGETSDADRAMYADLAAEFGHAVQPPAHPKVNLPKGIYAEPYYSFVLCLYRD